MSTTPSASSIHRAVDDPRLRSVEYVIEATNDERHLLWVQHSSISARRGWGTGRVDWPARSSFGWVTQIGSLDGFPVNIELTFDVIMGHQVLFWTDCSRVVDREMYPPWLRKHVAAYETNHTNAANFGHCLAHLEKAGVTP